MIAAAAGAVALAVGTVAIAVPVTSRVHWDITVLVFVPTVLI